MARRISPPANDQAGRFLWIRFPGYQWKQRPEKLQFWGGAWVILLPSTRVAPSGFLINVWHDAKAGDIKNNRAKTNLAASVMGQFATLTHEKVF